MPHRRRVRLAALRLRDAAPRLDAGDRQARPRRAALPRQEGRGIGLAAKLQAYALQDRGLDTVEANERLGFPPDLRDYGIGAQILVDLGVREIEVLTNNPAQDRRVSRPTASASPAACRSASSPTRHNRRYLATKRDKLGHLLDLKLGET